VPGAAADVACLRWRSDRTHSWRRTSEGGLDPGRYGVTRIGAGRAKQYVTTHHYSGTFGAERLSYGLFDLGLEAGPLLCGVAVLSVPQGGTGVLTSAFPRLEPLDESLELGRLVLDDSVPGNGESYFVAEAFRLAAAEGIRGIVSFSDPVARRDAAGRLVLPGHVGIVYQALNGRHIGRSWARTHWLMPDGTFFNPRAMQKIRKQEQGHEYAERQLIALGAPPMRAGQKPSEWLALALRAAGGRPVRHPGCIKYAFTAGTRAQRRHVVIAPAALPYPKQDVIVLALAA
jgi:hypothetical protein